MSDRGVYSIRSRGFEYVEFVRFLETEGIQEGASDDYRKRSHFSARNGLLSYRINQDNVSLDELAIRLSSIFSVRADKAMFIKGDDNLAFSSIAMVMDLGRRAGADHIGLLTPQDHL